MKRVLGSSVAKALIGLLVGIVILVLVSRTVNIVASIDIVRKNLLTPRGIGLALLSGVAFLCAFSIRGLRWKLFLSSISNIKADMAVRVYLVSVFINFLLPISGGEIAKTLILRRIAGIPISRSLPTVAIDRSLDLLPALVIMTVVPLLGMQMEIRLWFVLGTVGGFLITLGAFIGLMIWKRSVALVLLRKITSILPSTIGARIEAFATSFVDSLFASTRLPSIFFAALALTSMALICDGLFAMLAFWIIGFPISYGMALFGYTLFNMFFLFPTPPGQVGTNEAVGLLVFTGLLHLPQDKVISMFIFSHPWAAFLMCAAGLTCLKTLGLKLSIAIRIKAQPEESREELIPEKGEIPILR